MGWLAVSRFVIRTRHRELLPFILRVLKQTQGKPCSPVQHNSCVGLSPWSLPETVHIAAGAVSRLVRVKSLYPTHTSSQPAAAAAARSRARRPGCPGRFSAGLRSRCVDASRSWQAETRARAQSLERFTRCARTRSSREGPRLAQAAAGVGSCPCGQEPDSSESRGSDPEP
jgi:hypothetical protein